jgi:hypothetical protein
MKRLSFYHRNSGVTLAEMVVYSLVGVIVACVAYTFLVGTTQLYAKNLSLVHSHTDMRSVLDRTLNNMQQGNSLPVLIDTTGATVATPPSAGLYYDAYRGDPYVITNPSGNGLAAGTTTLTLTYSTASLASPPAPVAGDAIIISNPGGDVRVQLSACVAGSFDAVNSRQPYTVTLSTALASTISWTSAETRTATLVHREAFIVVPCTGYSELRYFKNFEPIPSAAALATPSNYTVVTRQLSVLTGEVTPFSIATVGTDKIVKASFFARCTDYSSYLTNRQANEFNTFVRVNTSLSSRLRPQE